MYPSKGTLGSAGVWSKQKGRGRAWTTNGRRLLARSDGYFGSIATAMGSLKFYVVLQCLLVHVPLTGGAPPGVVVNFIEGVLSHPR